MKKMRECIIVIQSFSGDIQIRRITLTSEQHDELGVEIYTTITEEDFTRVTGSFPHITGEVIPHDVIISTR